MADAPAAAASGRAPTGGEPGLIRRPDLVAALDRAVQKRVTIISAPAGTGKTSLLRAWAGRLGQDCRIAFMTVRPGQHDMQLFWLTMLGAVRGAGTGEGGAQLPPAAPGLSGSAMVDKVLSELEESCDRSVLVIDDLHELSSPEAAGQLTALLTRLPPGVRVVVATRRDLPLRLHKLRLAGDLAEIRAAQLRFTEHETCQLLAAAGIALPEHVVAMLHQRTEGWAAGLRPAAQPRRPLPGLHRSRSAGRQRHRRYHGGRRAPPAAAASRRAAGSSASSSWPGGQVRGGGSLHPRPARYRPSALAGKTSRYR
jgi:LuxR family transcriptional regulator, maltose regulon positive regulatory protein